MRGCELGIFLAGTSQATLDMLENKLVTVQKRIQEPCHIEDRSLCDSSKQKNPEKRSLLSQNTYFRCGKVPDEMSRKIIFKYDYL